MSHQGPPPPPPPHGENPKTTSGGGGGGGGLGPGNYDIFVIPQRDKGGGFIYLPSMSPNGPSFAAGFASALVLVVIFQSMAPAFQVWWSNFQGMGSMGMTLLLIAVAIGAWAWGKSQAAQAEASSSNAGGHASTGGSYGARPNPQAHSSPPPNAGGPPPPPHNEPPPSNQNRGGGPKTSWQQAPPQPEEAPPPEPPRPETPPPRPKTPPPRPKTPPSRAKSPQPKPKTPTPAPPPKPKEDSTWEKAREETRRREAERKAKLEEEKRKAEAARRLREFREKEARERERRDKEAREQREKLERENKEKEELKARLEKETRERERLEKEKADREAKEQEDARKKEIEDLRRKEAWERKKREMELKIKREAEEKSKREAEEAAQKARQGTPTNNARPPAPSASASARTHLRPDDDAYSYRPYDTPKSSRRTAPSSVGSESSWAHSATTARTTPPPSMRGPYTTKDPDKIVIKAVYLFMNQYAKTPASNLLSGIGTVTDGLILRITTEGLFIDDDVRGVPQREWDVKAWTLKLVEVWCPPHCLSGSSSSSGSGPSANQPTSFLHKMAQAQRATRNSAADRGANKPYLGDEAEGYLAEMLKSCKECCRLGLCESKLRNTNMPSSAGQTGEWKSKGLHVLRATVRDQEGKRYLFVVDEEEAWKLSVGLSRLRKGTQVRQLGVSGMTATDARTTLDLLGWV
ncbi:hypothetical protein VDGE_03580 [Verticillium dahliae]|uniref:Trans-sialidase-like protein n=1 Tax=Verticillium dahliae TaxID=27337 RepID=A0A444S796_VERDA|nr:hypothetical protein VDGE_03580 [Verticillium dahliae]